MNDMSRHLIELESILQQLMAEHRKLLGHIDVQQAAMKAMAVDAMEDATHRQESVRLRIATLDDRRQTITRQLAVANKCGQQVTIARIAELFPQRGPALLRLRDDLRATMQEVARRTGIASRLAGALLGHLNTAVRLIAGAVEQAGVYTKSGSPQIAGRIGVMEAVG
jgi:Cu/Ag efflux pump CusA